jgi:hypothetical protein
VVSADFLLVSVIILLLVSVIILLVVSVVIVVESVVVLSESVLLLLQAAITPIAIITNKFFIVFILRINNPGNDNLAQIVPKTVLVISF